MDRFNCNGELNVWAVPHHRFDDQLTVKISILHHQRHVPYVNISMPPDGLDYIKEHIHSTPGLIGSELSKDYPDITQAQVYSTWSRLSEKYWKKHEDPIVSARKLLGSFEKDVDPWELTVPVGVVAIAWGCPSIATKIGSKVVEVGLDATCK
jgi:hypothetical protein